jgi:cohesin complex subunit SA-1/2
LNVQVCHTEEGAERFVQMVDRALHLLTLHVIWKARNLVHLATEEESYRETLREQRDSLVEKLVEYAIGTQSNTLLSVKRAVRDSFDPL